MYRVPAGRSASSAATLCGVSRSTALPQPRQTTCADLGKQQPQIVGHFGRRADGRSARSAAAAAGHGDGGRNAVDPLGFRLLQPVEELPGVGRKALDVAPLPLGIERVEGQAALAAAAQPAEHDELAVRDIDVDRFEVVDRHASQRNVSRNAHGASQ